MAFPLLFWSSFITNVLTECYLVNCPTLCTLTSPTSSLYFSAWWNACWTFSNARAQATHWNSYTLNPQRMYNQFSPSNDTCVSGLSYEKQGSGSPSANTDLSPWPESIGRRRQKPISEIVEITNFFQSSHIQFVQMALTFFLSSPLLTRSVLIALPRLFLRSLELSVDFPLLVPSLQVIILCPWSF